MEPAREHPLLDLVRAVFPALGDDEGELRYVVPVLVGIIPTMLQAWCASGRCETPDELLDGMRAAFSALAAM